MTVATKHVTGRRSLQYDTLADLLRDAEQLAGGEVESLGNWDFSQVLQHLAATINCSIDGFPFRAPWPVRAIATVFMKRRFMTKSLPAGFQLPTGADPLLPEQTSPEAALETLRTAIARLDQEPQRSKHPALGRLSAAEWYQVHLRHAELHMSFLVAKQDTAPADGDA